MREPTYTIGDAIARGDRIWGYCSETSCRHIAVLDLTVLRDRLGPDHGAFIGDSLQHPAPVQARWIGARNRRRRHQSLLRLQHVKP